MGIWLSNKFGVILLYISYDINYFYYYILQMGEVLPKIVSILILFSISNIILK